MLEVGSISLSFEPDGRSNDSGAETINFFDNGTNTLCTLRNNGGLGLTCKCLEKPDVVSLRTKDKGPTRLVKLSPNGKMVVFQRQNCSVDVILIGTTDSAGSVEFTVNSKHQEPLITVDWVNDTQLLLVSKQCIELITINEAKRTYKLQKSTNVSASWCIYYAKSNLCILGTGANSATIQPITVFHSQFNRLKSFDIDFSGHNTSENLLEKDVCVTSLYGKIYVLVIRYNVRSTASNNKTSDLALYELSGDDKAPSKLKYTLSLGFGANGIGINIIDNLIIVHHQPSGVSKVFDIALALNEDENLDAVINTSIHASPSCTPHPSLYSRMWIIFQPYIIADSMMGMMYKLIVQHEKASEYIDDKFLLLKFLLNRENQTSLIISTLLNCVKNRELSLRKIGKVFDIMAKGNVAASQKLIETTKLPITPVPHNVFLIDQGQLISGLFIPLKDDLSNDLQYVGEVMLQYLNAIYKAEITVDDYFLELLVQTLADAGEMTTLHQLVTYRVISDLKPLASLLLGYEARCKQLFQSGVDILCRQKGIVEIVEVLLSKGLVVDAVRFLDTQFGGTHYSQAKLLEAASKKERLIQYAVQSHLASKRGKQADISGMYKEEDISSAELEVALNVLYD